MKHKKYSQIFYSFIFYLCNLCNLRIKNIKKIFVFFLSFVVITLSAAPTQAGLPVTKKGVVAAKGLIPGPNGYPIFAEFDDQGKVIDIIGEALPDTPFGSAVVMSAETWRNHIKTYNDFKTANRDGIARGSYLMTRAVYKEAREIAKEWEVYLTLTPPLPSPPPDPKFVTENGTPVTNVPSLLAPTQSVLVRGAQTLGPDSSPILFESPIDLTNAPDPAQETKSLLLNSSGQVIHSAATNIGYRVSFFLPENFNPLDLSQAANDGRRNYNRSEHDTALSPVSGTKVYITASDAKTYTDAQGNYALNYTMPVCPGFTYMYNLNLIAELQYTNFNPKSRKPLGVYFARYPVWDLCNGTGGVSYVNFGIPIMTGVGYYVQNSNERYNFKIDVMALTGQAILTNTNTGPRPPCPAQIPITDTTGYCYTDPGGEIDFTDQGLLNSISEQDLSDTDIYVFRVSNGQPVTSREGLKSNEAGGGQDGIFYKMLIRGPRALDYFGGGSGSSNREGSFESFQARTNMNEDLYKREADHLRVGEQIKIIVINRQTGYIGTAVTTLKGAADGRIDFPIETIELRPPNLKIKAERTYNVEAGLTRGTDRNYLIGFEGSGLTSDTVVEVTTEWLDHDGSPLPDDLPGYTGRLGKVVTANTLGAVGGIANFEISPGTHIQVVKLQDTTPGNEHYYIHVCGQPEERQESCQLGPDPVAPEDIYQYRPARHVPVRVALYDQTQTLDNARMEARLLQDNWQPDDPAPVLSNLKRYYQWPYRPEMQFSVIDLRIKDIGISTTYDPDTGEMVRTINTEYDLTGSPFETLERLGIDRQLLFTLGYSQQTVEPGETDPLTFTEIDNLINELPAVQAYHFTDMIDRLEPEDYLTLQLFQADDAANGLYELSGLPLIIMNETPLQIERKNQLALWNPSQLFPGEPTYTDTYTIVRLFLTEKAQTTVTILDKEKTFRRELLPATDLPPGDTYFIVDYETLTTIGLQPGEGPDFFLKIESTADIGLPNPLIHTIELPGELTVVHATSQIKWTQNRGFFSKLSEPYNAPKIKI